MNNFYFPKNVYASKSSTINEGNWTYPQVYNISYKNLNASNIFGVSGKNIGIKYGGDSIAELGRITCIRKLVSKFNVNMRKDS